MPAFLFADIDNLKGVHRVHGDPLAREFYLGSVDMLETVTREYDGEIVERVGDCVLSTFPDVAAAVCAAEAMHKRLISERRFRWNTRDAGISLRIGVHRSDRNSRNVNRNAEDASAAQPSDEAIAARLASFAKRNETLLTAETVAELPETLRGRVIFLERFQLKGLPEPVALYEMPWPRAEAEAAQQAHLLNADDDALELMYGEVTIVLDADCRRVTLGRSSACDLTVREPLASREHAIIEYAQGVFTLTDTGTTNGTYVSFGYKEYTIQGAGYDIKSDGRISLGRSTDDAAADPIEVYIIDPLAN